MYRFLALLALLIALSAPASDSKYPYTVSKGEIAVFGHTLRSGEVEATEGEYQVSFEESPNKQYVLIVYDVPFEKGAVWLYDKISKAMPQPVKTERLGRHFGVDWYGDHVFAVFGAGMGYKTSRLFKVETLDRYKELVNIIALDTGRDVFALLESDKDFNYFIHIGRAFHSDAKDERFPIPLYNQDLVGAASYIDDLRFTSKGFTVHYKNRDNKAVVETFQSSVIENAKP